MWNNCIWNVSQKAETNCTRITVGGNIINFPGDVTMAKSDPTTAKLVLDSVLSNKNKNSCAPISPTSNWKIPWTDMNIWNCHWKLSHLVLSNNKNYKTYHTKDLCIWRCKKSCMDWPKQAILTIINWSNIWPNLCMIHNPLISDCDINKHGPFNFHW